MEINKIYNEDCIETMRRMDDKSIDVILTSPPYNKSRQASYSEESLATRQGHYKDFNDARSNEEYIGWTLERFAEFERVLKDDGVVCYNMGYGSNSKTGQNIYDNFYNIIEAENNDGPCDIHKATYSSSLCFQLLDRYGVADPPTTGIVYDPFMGTGTTAIAAIEQKMNYVGSEISAEYVQYANERIALKASEPGLF